MRRPTLTHYVPVNVDRKTNEKTRRKGKISGTLAIIAVQRNALRKLEISRATKKDPKSPDEIGLNDAERQMMELLVKQGKAGKKDGKYFLLK